MVRKLRDNPDAIRVTDYWQELGLAEGQGYILSEKNRHQYDATALRDLPNLVATRQSTLVVDVSKLEPFRRTTLHMPRNRAIYRSPLVLVKQSPGMDRRKGFGYLAFEDLAYVSSYYGYSTAGHSSAELLARYLHLLVHSNLLLHFGLVTGVQFGAERNKLQKQTIEDFPLVRLERLKKDQRQDVTSLSGRLIARDPEVFDDIDHFFAEVYGLTEADLNVVKDTLDVGQAYRESSGRRACTPPTRAECTRFVQRLRGLIAPLLEMEPHEMSASLWFPRGAPLEDQTFGAILLGRPPDEFDEGVYFQKVLPLADDTGASQVLMRLAGNGLLVALRNQYRYWTKTRARLLSADIVREYLDAISP